MKSVLDTINLGYDLPHEEKKFVEGDSLKFTMKTGYGESNSILKKMIVEECSCIKNEDSIIDSVDTGLGSENTVIVECPKPEFKIPLCKENYLGEFENAIEKQLARYNLDVYSKEEVDNVLSKMVASTEFITKTEVKTMIDKLDFVDSSLRSVANYEIPDNLFKL